MKRKWFKGNENIKNNEKKFMKRKKIKESSEKIEKYRSWYIERKCMIKKKITKQSEEKKELEKLKKIDKMEKMIKWKKMKVMKRKKMEADENNNININVMKRKIVENTFSNFSG